MKLRRPKYCKSLRHTVAAFLILLILSIILISPWAALSPGIARQIEGRFSAEPVLPADKDKAQERSFCYAGADAPLPYLRCGTPIEDFETLRQLIIVHAGFDFLAKCGDMMRPTKAKSSKIGVSFRSRHKTGEAFDYNQEDYRVLTVREYKSGSIYWRTYLLCAKQDGSLGKKANLQTDNEGLVTAYVFDFTAAAESLGWKRIHAHRGWMSEPSHKEYYTISDDVAVLGYGWYVERILTPCEILPQLRHLSASVQPLGRFTRALTEHLSII